MARYIEDDSESGHTVLVTAGIIAGVVAGALVAQRLGGWRGLRRLLKGRRGPLLRIIRAALPAGALGSVLDAVGIERIVTALLGDARTGLRRRLDERAAGRGQAFGGTRRRRPDPDLDEFEVDDIERAMAGLDADTDEDDLDHDAEDEIVEAFDPEAIETAVLAAFRRHPVLRRRALEISVDDEGVLELTGWVRAERELRIARRIAARVDGVEQVIVDVAVRDGARTGARTGARAGVAAAGSSAADRASDGDDEDEVATSDDATT
ncbi:MAG: BON domain-containing protein [Gemmatimonadaceae bacterium]|nr:BON domain-containing protein [Gemmatimonadaceae bacterium]